MKPLARLFLSIVLIGIFLILLVLFLRIESGGKLLHEGSLRDNVDYDYVGYDYLGNDLLLSPSEFLEKRHAADDGDGEAAFILYMHFSIGLDEPKKAVFWLRRSAELGYPSAVGVTEPMDESNGSGLFDE